MQEKIRRILNKSEIEFKRWMFYNLIIMPITALLYLPYNLFVIGYSTEQVIRWGLTGIVMALFANFVIQHIATKVIRWMDKHIGRVENK